MMSPSTRRAWIEITAQGVRPAFSIMSPSTRRAWIEILFDEGIYNAFGVVALHPEGVDRNLYRVDDLRRARVALHPEGVDRNRYSFRHFFRPRVALHPEGVDRNGLLGLLCKVFARRPPPGGRG